MKQTLKQYRGISCFFAWSHLQLSRRRFFRVLFFMFLIVVSITLSIQLNTNDSFAAAPTLSVSVADTISVDIAPISAQGVFATSDTSINTVSIYTDNYTGYTLGIRAKVAGDNNLYNIGSELYPYPRIPSISNEVSEEDYREDTKYNNTWGYRPSTIYNNTTGKTEFNNNYLPAPTSDVDQTILAKTSKFNDTDDNYNIAIGTRLDDKNIAGVYSNTFVITVVTNVIPYSTYYDQNTSDQVDNMPSSPQIDNVDASTPEIVLSSNIPTRSGYIFKGWCTEQVADGATCTGTKYQPGGSKEVDYTTGESRLYAIWSPVVTFAAGDNIETIIVAKNDLVSTPLYATSEKPVIIENTTGDTYIVTIVPDANHKLGGWSGDVSNLASTELLTTTYTTSGSDPVLLIANGEAGSYTSIQDLTLASCTVEGNNVTDVRNNKSYTVKKITAGSTDFCFMASNLRLEGGTTLYPDTSNVTTSYTLPADTGQSGWVQDFCKPYMATSNGEYYYNWPTATARTNNTTGYSTCYNDFSNSVGDICPAGWSLLDNFGNVSQEDFANAMTSSGTMISTGYFYGGRQRQEEGHWWGAIRAASSSKWASYYTINIFSNPPYIQHSLDNKSLGFSTRCVRGSD